jgi:endonuclease/exonuclease/phosphatase (EEP) superfamily protein YafD
MLGTLIRKLLAGGVQLIWLGMWLFGLGVLLWLPLRRWPGDALFPVQILNYLMPWLLIGLIPMLTIALVARRFGLAAMLAIPTAIICVSYAPLFLPRGSIALAESQHLTVMSHNVWRGNKNFDRTVQVIQQQDPDVLLLQEAPSWVARKIWSGWQQSLPNEQLYLEYDDSIQQATISRYPLTLLESNYSAGRALKTAVDTPGGRVQVWNIHAVQPIVWREHRWQFSNLTAQAAQVDEPLIVGGDFNTTDQSEMYRLISRELRNAHWDAGWGFGFSFPSHSPRVRGVIPVPAPLIRIDHIFYNEGLFAGSARTLDDAGGSDHFPVVADFSLTAN